GGRQRARAATSAFDDLSRRRYDKLWHISVLRVVVSFLFRIAIPCRNARGIWYLVAVRSKLQRHWPLPPLVSAVVLPNKKYKTYLHEKQLRKERKERRQRAASASEQEQKARAVRNGAAPKSRKRPRKRKSAVTKSKPAE